MFKKIKELKNIYKSSGIIGVRNNIEYENQKLDYEIETRKKNMKDILNIIKSIKSTRK